MATTMAPRQPFASLPTSRLGNIRSIKNVNKALLDVAPSKPTKRSHATSFPDSPSKSDEENQDPDLYLSKKSKFTSVTKPSLKPILQRLAKPITSNGAKTTLLKRLAPLSKPRSVLPLPKFTKPTSAIRHPNLNRSLSDPAMPSSWFFDIHEDTPDEHASIMLEHQATTCLDISDDEGKSDKFDTDDKENIPPPGCPVPTRGATGRKRGIEEVAVDDVMSNKKARVNAMTGQREAMGALAVEDFYSKEEIAAAGETEAEVGEVAAPAIGFAGAKIFDIELGADKASKRVIKSFVRRSTAKSAAFSPAPSPLVAEIPSIDATLAAVVSTPITEKALVAATVSTEDSVAPTTIEDSGDFLIYESDHEEKVDSAIAN